MTPKVFAIRVAGLLLFLLAIALFFAVIAVGGFGFYKLVMVTPGGQLAQSTALSVLAAMMMWRLGRKEQPTRAEVLLSRCMFIWVLAYVASVVVVSASLSVHAPSTSTTTVVAMLPALPIGGGVLALWRYLSNEVDELQRLLTTRALVAAAGLTIFLLTLCGYLELYAHAPHFPLAMTPLIFFNLFAGTSLWVRWRYR